MKGFCTLLFSCCFGIAQAQYAPQVGITGSTAISASSSLFAGWATHCSVQRGLMHIADPSLGFASAGDSSLAAGPSDGSIVSLGDSGVATLAFAAPIYNGPGADFAVFENGFINTAEPAEAFLELAFVEVSSDGINYFRFPANSATPALTQLVNGDYITASALNNLAGKYLSSWGTPFDLQDLAGKEGLDINRITHVRLIDVIGDIGSHATRDSMGRKINDPFPTPFPSSGFDLDAVGVIHQVSTGISTVYDNTSLVVYPNPAADRIHISVTNFTSALSATLSSVTGVVLQQQALSQAESTMIISQLPAGMYYLTLHNANGNKWVEKIVKR